MEGSETTRERTIGKDGDQAADQKLLMSSKPLHRFVQRQPRSLGIVILMFGCAEVLMGFHLAVETEYVRTSFAIYIPFWQGALFIVCGNLSIYTEIHPSKKLVTVCLAMYVVSILGILVSSGYRIFLFVLYSILKHRASYYSQDIEAFQTLDQLYGIESVLFTSGLCAMGLFIFLSTVARLALKSTHTQVIVQHIPPPQSGATSN